MPSYPGNRNSSGSMMDRRNDGRSFQNRAPTQRNISPWESGVAPGAGQASGVFGTLQASMQSQFLVNRSNLHDNSSYGSYNMPNKIQRLDRIGNFDDRGGRRLFPSSNTSLMGALPQNVAYTSRSSNIQQRLGNTWSSGNSTDRRSGFGYQSSDSRRDNYSRRQSNYQSNRQSRSTRDSQSRSRYGDRKPSVKSDNDKTSVSADRDAKSPIKDESSKVAVEAKKETSEENEETVTPIEGTEKIQDDQTDRFPAEALYCHVCDLDTFATKKGYIRHLEGITHSRMAEKFHEKNDALWEYLNASAKFAEMRRKDSVIRSNIGKGMPLGRIVEKVILSNYANVGSCCGKRFTKKFDYHEHKLSVVHLTNRYFNELEVKKMQENLSSDVIEDSDQKIAAAIEANDAEPLSVANMPAFAPNTTYGLHYMKKNVAYKCAVCKLCFFSSLEEHCQSHKHYENILLAVNKEELKNMEEARQIKLAEKQKDENVKSENATDKYERHNEDDCESNLSEKNTDDKHFLSYEDLTKDDEMIILDEEKNEDELNFEPESASDEKLIDDNLNDEPKTILDDILDEPQTILDDMVDDSVMDVEAVDTTVMEDEIMAVGEDFEESEIVKPKEEKTTAEGQQKLSSLRRSSRVRL